MKTKYKQSPNKNILINTLTLINKTKDCKTYKSLQKKGNN